MVSLGGLDVAFGASAQLVRTNVMVLGCDAVDVTQAQMKTAHSLAQQRFPAALKPDFSGCISSIHATAPATALATDLTDDVEGGIIKNFARVPLLGPADIGSTVNNQNLPAIETILGVSVMKIAATTSSAMDDMFTDASPAGIEVDETYLTHQMNGALMASIMNDAESTEAAQQKISTVSFAPLMAATGATFTLTINANAAAAANTWLGLVDASESASTAGTTLANLKTALATGYIVQVTSICKV